MRFCPLEAAYVVDSSTATDLLKEMQQRREEQTKIARQELDEAKTQLRESEEEVEKTREQIRQYELRRQKNKEEGNLLFEVSPMPLALIEAQKQNMRTRVNIKYELLDQAETLARWADIKEGVALAKVTSDVDGKFSLAIPGPNLVLFAHVWREPLDSGTGLYCWLVRVPADGKLIMLTNKNTVDTLAPENFAADPDANYCVFLARVEHDGKTHWFHE